MKSRVRTIIPGILVLLSLSACDIGPGSPTPGTSTNNSPQPTPVSYNIPDDLAFIDLMVPHHQLAVDMARLAEQKATHGQLKGMARDIAWAQADEINRMNIWRQEIVATTGGDASSLTPGTSGHEMDLHVMGMDVDLDLLATSPNFDRDFLKAMLPHHRSAIDMARSALPHLKKVEVRDLANDIITTQQTEIDRMTVWLNEWK